MIKIAPSLLSADFACFKSDIELVERGGADLLHIDVMDGHFVPNLTIGLPVVKALKKWTKLPLDVHLMITNPEDFIKRFADSGADYLSVHIEVCPHLHKIIQEIKQCGMKAGVALNPATSLSLIDEIISDVDFILLMSVNPGFGGQTFIASSVSKIRRLRQQLNALHLEQVEIEVDGGISLTNIREVVDAGATIIVSGSGIFQTENPARTIQQMKGTI